MTRLRSTGLAAALAVATVACAVGSSDDGGESISPSPSPSQGVEASIPDDAGRANSAPPDAGSGDPDTAAPDGARTDLLLDARADVAQIDADASPAPPTDAAGGASGRDAAPLGPSDLLYYFPFDGDLLDWSGNGNDGTGNVVQFVADRAGLAGHAAHFDGATTWVSAPGALLPLMARERTITAWVKPASSPPPGLYGNAFVSWGSGDCLAQMWGLGDVSDAVMVWTGCNDDQTKLALAHDLWTFVAVRFTAPTTVRVWTNGSSVDVNLSVGPSTAPSLLWIGAETTTNVSSAIRRYFAGDVDAVRIYGRALGDDEVAAVQALP